MANGEFKSLLDLVKDHNQIVIPIIQRDYAQGRSAVEELRNDFIEYLKNNLQDNQKVELDFVYGTLADNRYTILDGQQRLTTLFLIHWYLAKLDKHDDSFKNSFVNNHNINFTYETRASAGEFCKALIIKEFSLEDVKDDNLSNTISNKNWFIPSWHNDPTVCAMLNMIDTIHDNFHAAAGKNFYQHLEQGIIGFKFLELEEFQLTDDLYIKMNSTGLPLTHFENFKAHLEKHIKAIQDSTIYYLDVINKNVSLQKYFSFMMDSIWSDFFWGQRQRSKQKFDDIIMNLIHSILTNKFYKENDEWNDDFIIQGRRFFIPLSCKKYIDHKVLDQDILTNITKFLNVISSDGDLLPEGFFYYNEKQLFDKITSGSPTYQDRLMFYAYFSYIGFHTKYENNTWIFNHKEHLKDWMRVIYNLVENTVYDGIEEYSGGIRAINSLIEHSAYILEHISQNSFKGFHDYQCKEESLKAQLICSNPSWYDILQNIEQHGYLKGQICFLLEISEITKDIQNPQQYQHSLMSNYDIFAQIFGSDGLKIKDLFWERALLSKGDYLVEIGKYVKRQSFCTNKDRDTSWKQWFCDRNYIIRCIFDDIKNYKDDSLDITKVLQQIIDNRDMSDPHSWQEQFIKYPKLFDHLGSKQRLAQKISDHGFCLLEHSDLGGTHCELHSLIFHLNNKDVLEFQHLKWSSYQKISGVSGKDTPHARFNVIKTKYFINVYFYNNHYSLWLWREDDSDYSIKQSYIDKATPLGFIKEDSNWYKLENLENEDAVIGKLKELDNVL